MSLRVAFHYGPRLKKRCQARMVCFCFMPECALCGGGGGDGGAAPAQGCPSPRLGPSLPRDVAANLASGTPCSCYMPDCVRCLGGDVDATTKPLTGIVAANEVPRCRTPAVKKARKRGHWRLGHVGCTLAQELEEDKRIEAERLNDRIYRLAEVCILSLQPGLSALELIGRQRGERWGFWEVVSGTGRFTAAVVVAGLIVGPPVDIIRFPGGLALDLLLQKNQALLQAVLEEARPRWLHLGPPCTYWTPISRCTASKTPGTWALLRANARELWFTALQMAFLQSQQGRKGSIEQPPRCVSWRLRATEEFYIEHPDWKLFVWPSCAYGMCDPITGAPWQKRQGFLSNADLGLVASRRCTCRVPHGVVQDRIKSGPWKGWRRTTIAGQYPPEMCQKLASVVRREVSAMS